MARGAEKKRRIASCFCSSGVVTLSSRRGTPSTCEVQVKFTVKVEVEVVYVPVLTHRSLIEAARLSCQSHGPLMLHAALSPHRSSRLQRVLVAAP